MKTVLVILLLSISFHASALQVIMENGCPVRVDNGGSACPGNSAAACVSNGSVVRWSADGIINDVCKKSVSADLHNCRSAGPQDFQCVVQGQSGDSVDYGIIVDGCDLDPRIIIK